MLLLVAACFSFNFSAAIFLASLISSSSSLALKIASHNSLNSLNSCVKINAIPLTIVCPSITFSNSLFLKPFTRYLPSSDSLYSILTFPIKGDVSPVELLPCISTSLPTLTIKRSLNSFFLCCNS